MRAGASQSVTRVNNCLFLIQLGQKLNNNLDCWEIFQFSIKYFLKIIKTQLKYLFVVALDQVLFVLNKEVTLSVMDVSDLNVPA